ncbi:acidic leucine-rich nuclear phosphoprotein 32 family member B-like [Cynara cardunculus var. scolymus]|uniref:acidic leucine-rich nuclear phosphoprotein 32 family member B-like n=1 Tax=Cynara cardunculus var. scolymus TaxID=59895 RepID=UPI000D62A741|nr:acidic leucine-rich nuclear phosphoprotein 32 family member B-like [Cynara cardunculus var. scolymus]
MASAQVDAVHVEDLTKPSEETTLGSATMEGSAKPPAPHNIESPCDEHPEDVDELGKEDELNDEEDQKGAAPQIIEDQDDDDDDEDDEEQVAKSAVRATDFSEEEGDDDV